MKQEIEAIKNTLKEIEEAKEQALKNAVINYLEGMLKILSEEEKYPEATIATAKGHTKGILETLKKWGWTNE